MHWEEGRVQVEVMGEKRPNHALEVTATRCAFTFSRDQNFQLRISGSVAVAVPQLELVRPKVSMDSLTWHVMDALADDWESIAQIRPHVHHYCGPASDQQIVDILRQLREDKLIEIMKVPEQSDHIFEIQPEVCWFGMTEAGRVLWDSEGAKYRDDERV
jgi:hypothetical protein